MDAHVEERADLGVERLRQALAEQDLVLSVGVELAAAEHREVLAEVRRLLGLLDTLADDRQVGAAVGGIRRQADIQSAFNEPGEFRMAYVVLVAAGEHDAKRGEGTAVEQLF